MSGSTSIVEPVFTVWERKALAIALREHRAGRLDEAADCYAQILDLYPHHPDTLHFAGLLELQRENAEQAILFFARATRVRPLDETFLVSLGRAHDMAGAIRLALACWRKAYRLNPGRSEALVCWIGGAWRAGRRKDAQCIALRARALAGAGSVFDGICMRLEQLASGGDHEGGAFSCSCSWPSPPLQVLNFFKAVLASWHR